MNTDDDTTPAYDPPSVVPAGDFDTDTRWYYDFINKEGALVFMRDFGG